MCRSETRQTGFGVMIALLLTSSAWGATSKTATAGNPPANTLEQIYLELEPLSEKTRRRHVSTFDAPVDLSVFTRLRRDKGNGRRAYSNATLIAGGHCYWIASVAGHSVLDQSYSRLANRNDIELMLPDGSWANPVEIVASPTLSWESDEMDDWALLVIQAPRCAFDDSQQFSQPLPHIHTEALNVDNLASCARNVQMLCYHFDQPGRDGQRMLERDCEMRHLASDTQSGSAGYISCKVDSGVSGCSPVCVRDGLWLNLGVFSKGLQRHRSNSHPQPVGAFRVMDGDIYATLAKLKNKYSISK